MHAHTHTHTRMHAHMHARTHARRHTHRHTSQAVIRVCGIQVEAISPVNYNQFKVEYQLPSIADKIIFSEREKRFAT